MNFLRIIKAYFSWHYYQALLSFFKIWSTFFWFIGNLFSVKLLIKNLFSPWRRIREYYRFQGDLFEVFSVLIINLLMRLVGVILRLILIFISLFAYLLVLIMGIILFGFWLILPLFIVFLFYSAIYFSFTSFNHFL